MLIYLKFFLCGMLTSLLFPPFFLISMGFIIFPYLIYLLEAKKNILGYRLHFLSGFLYGLGFFSVLLFWLKEPFFIDENTKNYAFFSYLLIIYCSLYFGFIFCIIKIFSNIVFKILMFPALIVLAEFICANLLYGFPWFSFALINSNNIVGLTVIFYMGSLGLSYITILFFLFPYIFLIIDKNYTKLLYLIYSILFILIFLLICFKVFKHENLKSKSISILIAQLNSPMNQNLNLENKNKKLNIITKIIRNSKSEIIIFAENDYPYLMDKNNIEFLQNKLNDNQNLIIGSTRVKNFKYYNSLFLIKKDDYQKFDKKILVPFGEFIPLREYFKFMEFIAGNVDFSKGKDNRYINLSKDISILPVICYEIIYYWNLINDNNTNLIVNLTNDSWFGGLLGPYQHFYFAKLRSAEFNKPIIRVSNNGISGLIDGNGHVKDYIKLNEYDNRKINFTIPVIENNYLLFHKFFFFVILSTILIGLFLNKKDEK